MNSVVGANTAIDPEFFDGRLLIEIETWSVHLRVSKGSGAMPTSAGTSGALNHEEGFEIRGHVLAPTAHRAKTISIFISLFGPELRFGQGHLNEIGQFNFRPEETDLTATLHLPQSTWPVVATCLNTVWKYLHLWTDNAAGTPASIEACSFSSTIHRNLSAWAGLE